MQGYRLIIAINILSVLILCGSIMYFAGSHGGAGEVTAGNAGVKDAVAKATTDSPVDAAADDAVTGTTIAESPNVVLNFAGETVIATPFLPDPCAEDYAANVVEVHRDECLDAGELDERTTGQLWGVSITTQAAYQVEQLYLDAQHRRLYMKGINQQGKPASWGHSV